MWNLETSPVVVSLYKRCTEAEEDEVSLLSRFSWVRLNIGPLDKNLQFEDYETAIEAVLKLWELHLEGSTFLIPVPDKWEENHLQNVQERLTLVFLQHIEKLKNCEIVQNCRREIKQVEDTLEKLQAQKKFIPIAKWTEIQETKEDLFVLHRQLFRRLTEFLKALHFLECKVSRSVAAEENESDKSWKMFCLNSSSRWRQIFCLLKRECERMQAALPLYGEREMIMQKIQCNQVTILIGETGSGKSTQLVQYLSDAGLARDGKFIVCTQPRRVAAMSLTKRVAAECSECYDFEVSNLSYRSQQPTSITYATDSGLLQLLITDQQLSQFSCVLVDEAHERTLHTDLLLALLKECIQRRPDLKLVIMSATADAGLLSNYFGGCEVIHVPGRKFKVDIHYDDREENLNYLSRVVNKVTSIHSTTKDGNILAFLTSQADVEAACNQLNHLAALVLPLHGKLQPADQQRVFEDTPNTLRKIILATNIAETSLTIPGIRYVVDSGLAKEVRYDAKTAMNSLRQCRISQSSATQRAGRAGRTDHGVCYRLYSRQEFETMDQHPVPEICRVHLGLASLKLLALGVQNLESFDFIEAPDSESFVHAMGHLRTLGAVTRTDAYGWRITSLGSQLEKLGIEPRVGKIVLDCISKDLGREGLVIGALILCAGTLFFRAGSEEEKDRADRLKMRFCHPHGDLLTILNVYREWRDTPISFQTAWCVDNSINSRGLRTCQEQIREMETRLSCSLDIQVPLQWSSDPAWSVKLRKIILSATMENLAMYSGSDRIGYDINHLKRQAYLHPSSSVLVYGNRPEWIVFSELLYTSKEFLVCVTVIEPEWILEINKELSDDIEQLKRMRLCKSVIPISGKALISGVCGKHNSGLNELERQVQQQGKNSRCVIEHTDSGLQILATSEHLQFANDLVMKAVQKEKRRLLNECIERRAFEPAYKSPGILLTAGGVVKLFLMPGEFVTVEVFHPDASKLVDSELLALFEGIGEGITSYRKLTKDMGLARKWGSITYRSFLSAQMAIELLNGKLFQKHPLQVTGVVKPALIQQKAEFPAVRATITWLRRRSRGFAHIECSEDDVETISESCDGKYICGSYVTCRRDRRRSDTIFMCKLAAEATVASLRQSLMQFTDRNIYRISIPREDPPYEPSLAGRQKVLTEAIAKYVPLDKFQINIQEPQRYDHYYKAFLKFDKCVHEDAATAIESIVGTPLPGFLPWQPVTCMPVFQSVVKCSGIVLKVLRDEIRQLLGDLKKQHNELTVSQVFDSTGQRIDVSSTNLAVVARCKSAIDKLIEGTSVTDDRLGDTDLRLMFTREGFQVAKSVECQSGTVVYCDKRNYTVKVYGTEHRKRIAVRQLVSALVNLRDKESRREIALRGDGLPPGLMRSIVRKYGVQLAGLEAIAGVSVTMNHRRHVLYVHGEKESVMMVKKAIADSYGEHVDVWADTDTDGQCPICLCTIEDEYKLEACGHGFCRKCLVDQINSAIRYREGIPITCAVEKCGQRFLIVDITSLLTLMQQQELCIAAIGVFVAASRGSYKFCYTPDCPSVYKTSNLGEVFVCSICSVKICRSCHVEYHEGLSCEVYKQYKNDPDASLDAWKNGKKDVKNCPSCASTIEKIDGCNHISCRCGKHVCWVCLELFDDSAKCYSHMTEFHGAFG